MPIELTIDHCGPMANSAADVAKLLSVIAGPDGYDPRQGDVRVQDYLADLDKGAGGLRIAIVREGFGRPKSEEATDGKVHDAINRLREAVARVIEISIPMHLDGLAHLDAPPPGRRHGRPLEVQSAPDVPARDGCGVRASGSGSVSPTARWQSVTVAAGGSSVIVAVATVGGQEQP